MLRPRLTPERMVLLGLLLAAALYGRALDYDFILDDFSLILLNHHLDSWAHWHLAFSQHVWAFADPPVEPRHYRPVFALWLLLNKQLFGGVTPWWHLSSLLLHLAVSALVYRLGVRLGFEGWTAAFASVLFSLHPVHAEPVVWISASSDLLATLFVLAAFLAYLRHREQGSAFALSLSLLFAMLAILSKESAVVLPAVVLFYEWTHDRVDPSRPVVRALPYVSVVGVYVIMRRLAMPMSAGSANDADLITTITSLPLVAGAYAKTLLWPVGLSFFYAPEAASRWSVTAALVLIALALLGGLAWLLRKQPASRVPCIWLGLFSLVPIAAIAAFNRDNWVHDRHMYLPSVGFCLLIALLVNTIPQRVRLVVSAAWVCAFVGALVLQLPRFADELTLYAHAKNLAPTNLELRLAHAYALNMHGRHSESLVEYERIAAFAPSSAEAWANLGMHNDDLGRTAEARSALARALSHARAGSGLRVKMLFRLGSVESKLGEWSFAEAHLREAIRLDPLGWNYHATLAEVLRRQGRLAEAEREMEKESAVRREVASRRLRRK